MPEAQVPLSAAPMMSLPVDLPLAIAPSQAVHADHREVGIAGIPELFDIDLDMDMSRSSSAAGDVGMMDGDLDPETLETMPGQRGRAINEGGEIDGIDERNGR